jgi:HAD superfamily hydrolase (TIGR01509 family)
MAQARPGSSRASVPRAVIFDLDDTLYPYRRFRLSGFAALADRLAIEHGLDRRLGFAALVRASRGVDRGREVQACLAQYDLPQDLASSLIEALRHHAPRLRLPASACRTFAALRRAGWRIGVLTNGQPSIQSRKVTALGLQALVDQVVYAATCGPGTGKPDPECFAETVRQLGVPAGRAVMVGDDERCDVAGALTAGLHAIRCAVWTPAPETTAASGIVRRLTHVPSVAHALLEEASSRHAA